VECLEPALASAVWSQLEDRRPRPPPIITSGSITLPDAPTMTVGGRLVSDVLPAATRSHRQPHLILMDDPSTGMRIASPPFPRVHGPIGTFASLTRCRIGGKLDRHSSASPPLGAVRAPQPLGQSQQPRLHGGQRHARPLPSPEQGPLLRESSPQAQQGRLGRVPLGLPRR
jgi:hypothetical protein